MRFLHFDEQYLSDFIAPHEWAAIAPQVALAARQLEDGSGPGSDYLGWLDWPVEQDREELERIRAAARRIRKQSEVLVVVGIGGSYLGARAVLEALRPAFPPQGPDKNLDVYFAGTNLSGAYLEQLIAAIGARDFSVNMISKSGTTTEPAITFRVLRGLLEHRYGKQAAQRIYATTDKSRGALRTLADREGYDSFVVPDNVGGRFSVITAVGLLPIAAAGIDVDQFLAGTKDARALYRAPYAENACYRYAAARNILYRKGYAIEMLVNYDPRLHYVAEWWKQLYGESEGKDGKGLFPAAADLTADLHSMGQYMQDGRRHLFETLIQLAPDSELAVPADADNLDGLNYLTGKTLDYVNSQAARGTLEAHVSGGVPNLVLQLPRADAYHLGALLFFFMKACGVSGYLLGVNPFDQPGVEAYKRNMFRLLGKPGAEG